MTVLNKNSSKILWVYSIHKGKMQDNNYKKDEREKLEVYRRFPYYT